MKSKTVINNDIFQLTLVESGNAAGVTGCHVEYYIKSTGKYGVLVFHEIPSYVEGRFEISDYISKEELKILEEEFIQEIRPEDEKIYIKGMTTLQNEGKLYQ